MKTVDRFVRERYIEWKRSLFQQILNQLLLLAVARYRPAADAQFVELFRFRVLRCDRRHHLGGCT